VVTATCLVYAGCHATPRPAAPAIEFTSLPASGEGSPDKILPIAGRVEHSRPGQKIVLFAKSGVWWVQPTRERPYTEIGPGGRWTNQTHPGSEYAALLVEADYHPPLTTVELPVKGGAVVAIVTGAGAVRKNAKTLHFSGYEWQIRQISSDRSGTRNEYDAFNSWTDRNGLLHLRIAKQGDHWTSGEVALLRSLGYGSYRFVVRDVTHLEPGAVFSVLTWDDSGPPREMDIEVSRWGADTGKNAQYVVQPYYVPANTVRFTTPPGLLAYSFRWEPGLVAFSTSRVSAQGTGAGVVAEHVFTSGVPTPGNETVRMNLYVFHNSRHPLAKGCEVIVERFEYLP